MLPPPSLSPPFPARMINRVPLTSHDWLVRAGGARSALWPSRHPFPPAGGGRDLSRWSARRSAAMRD